MTVYNSNLALVRDVRQIHLSPGVFPLHFEDVAASDQSRHGAFPVFDRADEAERRGAELRVRPARSCEAAAEICGPEVTLVRAEKDAGSTKWAETKALLLSDNNGPVWKIGDEIVTGMSADSYRFPDLPGNLYSRPTLVWMLDNRGANAQKVEASYLDREYELEGGLRFDRDAR